VTESVLLDDPEATIALLHRLRDMGFRLAVDDFGTGYSSLSYLRQLPVHEVKIDRGFVSDLVSSAQGQVIVESVVRMCHALGAHVVAEGVETQEQADVLRAMGCDRAQGWFFGRPQSEDAARRLVRAAGRLDVVA
jgi:Amt family ammonium transporter